MMIASFVNEFNKKSNLANDNREKFAIFVSDKLIIILSK